ncbi:MAG: aldehyde ferredoxin oxidoreductase family protein [Actinobacteria bacterium]|nr:aldehyde ferredoxin oxidoreductase family protein [Actinomycetota bacterium]MBU1942522.1 aldehyde ferredoxin oxidoreductase family protein [Actinomycetota bacterium]MBU2687250.1 aldehyde ferredoxin oxidoreductase family protein [Actinomycetota bacterium]
MHGYAGRVLEVDLTGGEIKTLDINEEDCRAFLGGTGLAAKMYLDRFPGDVDPLSPENPLILMTGPYTGSRVPGGNRFGLGARSPLTGHWGEASVGGYFGVELKSAGYDGIIFTGRSDKPVYLWINGDDVELRDAADLWGRDTYETTDILWKQLTEEAGKKPKVAAIGPAGEIGVRFAAVVHDKHHVGGRTGMGAVMGSKNLKAVAVLGTGQKQPEADAEAMKVWRKNMLDIYRESLVVESLRAFGTNANLEVGAMLGDVPIKNWQLGEWDEGISMINGPTYSDDILVRGYACWACPIGCKRVIKIDEELYKVEEGAGPEYETIVMLGANLFNSNLASIAKGNEICNRLGIDTITMGETVALVIEAQEKGLLSAEECDGIAIDWGDADAMLKLVEKTGRMEGFGARMAEGSRALSESIGGEAPTFAVQMRGMELPAHDPRGFHGFVLAYATSSRGACHCASTNLYMEQGSNVALPELDLEGPFDEQSSVGKAYLTARAQEIAQILNSAVVCHFCATSWTEPIMVDAFNALTGLGVDLDGFMEIGERIWFIKRGLQQLWGSAGDEDVAHPRVMTPLEEGPAAGSVPDWDLMKREYYEYRKLDENGNITREKCEQLGMGYLADRLGI